MKLIFASIFILFTQLTIGQLIEPLEAPEDGNGFLIEKSVVIRNAQDYWTFIDYINDEEKDIAEDWLDVMNNLSLNFKKYNLVICLIEFPSGSISYEYKEAQASEDTLEVKYQTETNEEDITLDMKYYTYLFPVSKDVKTISLYNNEDMVFKEKLVPFQDENN